MASARCGRTRKNPGRYTGRASVHRCLPPEIRAASLKLADDVIASVDCLGDAAGCVRVLGRAEWHGLRRRIADADGSDAYLCRPHVPGKIRHALLGGELTAPMRQGRSMWCPAGHGDARYSPRDVGEDRDCGCRRSRDRRRDYWEGHRQPGGYRWARFTLTFDDGGRLMLIDLRRLGRVGLCPPVSQLGPDAQLVKPAQFRVALAADGAAPVRARIMDQGGSPASATCLPMRSCGAPVSIPREPSAA